MGSEEECDNYDNGRDDGVDLQSYTEILRAYAIVERYVVRKGINSDQMHPNPCTLERVIRLEVVNLKYQLFVNDLLCSSISNQSFLQYMCRNCHFLIASLR